MGCLASTGGPWPAGPRTCSSIAHLLFQLLVDPDAGVDRSRAYGAGTQLAIVVLHPRPPCREDVRRRQPDVGRPVQNLAGQLLQHRSEERRVGKGCNIWW